MQSRNITIPPIATILAIIFGLIFAFLVGSLAGHTNYTRLGIIFGGIGVIGMCLWLRTAIWLLIPTCWALTGRISLLPLPFNVRDLAVLLVAVMFGIFYAFKLIRSRSASGWIEILAAINFCYVGTLYLRHPVGTQAFGSNLVGGRPYFDATIGLVAFLILRKVVINPKQAKIFPLFLVGSSVMVTGINLLTRLVPSLVPVIAPFYSGFSVQSYLNSEGFHAESRAGERYTEFLGVGSTMVQALCAYFKPISLILPSNPFRMVAFMVSLVAIFFSGYRSALLAAGSFFLISSYFQGGMRDVWRAVAIGFVALFMVVALHLTGFSLPLQAQRALSFIPFVPWDQGQKEDAAGSTQWRVEMWKTVLVGDKYIKNKILGDGFGFAAYEYQIMLSATLGGQGFIGGAQQEAQMISGAYHSGPLSSIRYGGAVGLALILAFNFYLMGKAPGLIRSTQRTPFYTLALFMGVPIIYSPIFFIFIFGAYDTALPDTLFVAGMFRLMQNSIREYTAARASAPGAEIPPASPEKVAVPRRLITRR